MSALALLRDLAGCRAVLHDARLEARPVAQVADLERVVAEAEAAIWDGGEAERVDCWVFRRKPPQRPDVSAEAFDDYRYDAFDPDDPDASYEDAHRIWADERRREHLDRVRAYLATDWLAWDDRSARTRGRAWARRAGGFHGVDFTTFDAILRDHYPAEHLAELARSREQLVEAVAAIDAAGGEPDVVWMNPETCAQLQAQLRADLITGHRRVAARVGRRAGATTAARTSALARVYGTGAFEVPRGARLSFDTVAMPPTSSAPDAFDPPAARRSDTADALAYAYGYMRDRAAPGPQRTGYRPRWAPALAATLANLITDGPASGVPGMGDP